MQLISSKNLENSKAELEITVTAEEFEGGIEAAYKKNKNKMTVPGFRKGKATRKMLERYYGEGVFYEDAVSATYGKAYEEAVKEAGIKPIAPPEVDIIKIGAEGYNFKATVYVAPEVTLGEYKGIKAERSVTPVTKKEIDAELEALRQKNARLIEVTDRPAADGDTVLIDYSGSVDGEKFAGGTAEKQNLKIGSGQFIPGFEEQIIGKNTGESFDIGVKFPEEYHASELAGKDAVFAVTLHGIKKTELPLLDDEFIKDISSEFDTLADYTADLKKKFEEAREREADAKLEDALVDAVVEGMKVDMPEILVERQLDSIAAEFDQRLHSQGLDLEKYLQMTGMAKEDFRKNFKDRAEKRAKVSLALEKIVELENITASAEEIDKEYAAMAERYGVPAEKVKAYIPQDDISHDLAVNKAVDLIKSTAEITESKPKKSATKKAAPKAAKSEDTEA